MDVVREAHRPSRVHETGEQYLASRIRIGADDSSNRSKEGNGHRGGGMLEGRNRIVLRKRIAKACGRSRVPGHMLNAAGRTIV